MVEAPFTIATTRPRLSAIELVVVTIADAVGRRPFASGSAVTADSSTAITIVVTDLEGSSRDGSHRCPHSTSGRFHRSRCPLTNRSGLTVL